MTRQYLTLEPTRHISSLLRSSLFPFVVGNGATGQFEVVSVASDRSNFRSKFIPHK